MAALLLWCGLSPAAAWASALEVSPVAVNLVAGQSARVIEVRNRGGSAAAIQLRAFAWSQSGDVDVLAPTKDIILSPPIFTVQPGATQTIRLLLRAKVATAERTYRLLLDEVPPPQSSRNSVGIALRISLPVFAAGTTPPSRSLVWRARRGPGNQIHLLATNSGNAYDKVHAIAVTLPDGSRPRVAPTGDNPYVLPGTQRQWFVKGATPPTSLTLKLTTQMGTSEHVLVVDP